MSLTFDTPKLELDACITKVQITDLDCNPNRVIDTDEGFQINVDWHLEGCGALYLGGCWTVRALVESIGEGFEGQIGRTMDVPLNGGFDYSTVINVPAHTVPPPEGTDTVYKLVVLIAHTAVNGQKTEMAGFGEGPYFEVRKP